MIQCYWKNTGKYQKAVDQLRERFPSMQEKDDPKLVDFRTICQVYHDYHNNGGHNRRLLFDLKDIKLNRGSVGNKALRKIKSYTPVNPDQQFFSEIPKGLEPYYEEMMNGAVETLFPELIKDKTNV